MRWRWNEDELFDTKLNVLHEQDKSIYPNYSILLKQHIAIPQNFSCIVEIPFRNYPAIYYSDSIGINDAT